MPWSARGACHLPVQSIFTQAPGLRKKWRAASGGGAQAGSPGGQEACHLACRVCPPEQSRSLAGACLALSTACSGASDRRAPLPAAADSAGAVAGAEPRPTIITARLQVTTLVSS